MFIERRKRVQIEFASIKSESGGLSLSFAKVNELLFS